MSRIGRLFGSSLENRVESHGGFGGEFGDGLLAEPLEQGIEDGEKVEGYDAIGVFAERQTYLLPSSATMQA